MTDAERVERVYDVVTDILRGMGIVDVAPDAIVAAPADHDGAVLLEGKRRFQAFARQLAFRLRFIGYPLTPGPNRS